MRFVLVCLFVVATVVGARAADVEFTRVWPGWRDAESFDRVLEYFTGKEYSGQEIILRTQAKDRAGFYFLTRVKNPGAAMGAVKFQLQIVAPNNPVPKTFSFATNLPAGTSVFDLGLTGADWTDPKNPPVAWKLELVREDGQVLATEKSFLWEKPAK